MIKTRFNYWSCSKIADWIRGEGKPLALGFDDWDEWHKDTKENRPIRYFIAEKLLNRIQDVVYFPVDLFRTFKAYWNNRFVHKTHCLKTGLKPGHFYELDDRILHALFNELKEFVEVDLALSHMAWHENQFEVRKGRCAEAGIAHLKWAMNLKMDESNGYSKRSKKYGKPTRQAEISKEIMDIYNWWNARDSRPDPVDVSGWSECLNSSEEERIKKYKKMQSIERKYDKEDDEMIGRLLAIRRDLWC